MVFVNMRALKSLAMLSSSRHFRVAQLVEWREKWAMNSLSCENEEMRELVKRSSVLERALATDTVGLELMIYETNSYEPGMCFGRKRLLEVEVCILSVGVKQFHGFSQLRQSKVDVHDFAWIHCSLFLHVETG